MCATYTPSRRDRIAEQFGAAVADIPYERIAFPGSMAPIVRLNDKNQNTECVSACFGMVPSWAEMKLSKQTYNARSETVASKYSFRNAWQRAQFCIIPAESIFEPSYESGKAVRWQIAHHDDCPLGIAGIWETRPDGPDGAPLISFSMLTINADLHPLMRRFHKPGEEKRSVVVLPQNSYAAWLHADTRDAAAMLLPYPAELLISAAAPVAGAADKEPPRQADLFSF
ncbi:MAG TPA: SOS response-associated peptidase family protein [Burkholderiaceae bacterium]|jgi:putative SOS response-associated peptidase YedK